MVDAYLSAAEVALIVHVDAAQHADIEKSGGLTITREKDDATFVILPGGEDVGDAWRHQVVPVELVN